MCLLYLRLVCALETFTRHPLWPFISGAQQNVCMYDFCVYKLLNFQQAWGGLGTQKAKLGDSAFTCHRGGFVAIHLVCVHEHIHNPVPC
jgi:hypothetical protein